MDTTTLWYAIRHAIRQQNVNVTDEQVSGIDNAIKAWMEENRWHSLGQCSIIVRQRLLLKGYHKPEDCKGKTELVDDRKI